MLADANALDGGFRQPVFDAQATFRAVMDAMARPATVTRLAPRAMPPAPLSPAAGAVALALVDADTPVWLDGSFGEAVRTWLTFHTGARFAAAPDGAAFAFAADPSAMAALEQFAQGTQEYPDRSATIVLQLASLEGGVPLTFQGPGIKGEALLAPVGMPADFARQWRDNRARFPRGVDLVLTAGDAIACLPRSSRLIRGG